MGADCAHASIPFDGEELIDCAPMRMLLLSTGLNKAPFLEALDRLLAEKNREGTSCILYIPDGSVGRGADAATLTQRFTQSLSGLSSACEVRCAELRCHNRESLVRILQGVDCIFVDCGATFYLRHCMRVSGFDELVKPLVENMGVIYVGASAGGIAAGQTVSIAFWKGWDNPGYGTEWDLSSIGYDGLGLIPGGKSVFPHYRDQTFSSLVETKSEELDHELVVLDEDHCYIVNGSVEVLWPPTLSSAPQNWQQHGQHNWCSSGLLEEQTIYSSHSQMGSIRPPDPTPDRSLPRERSQSAPMEAGTRVSSPLRSRGYTWSQAQPVTSFSSSSPPHVFAARAQGALGPLSSGHGIAVAV
jgi:peptidase E